MKKRRIITGSLMTLFLILTPVFNNVANSIREVGGYGGECFIFLMPMLFLGLYETALDFKKDKNER